MNAFSCRSCSVVTIQCFNAPYQGASGELNDKSLSESADGMYRKYDVILQLMVVPKESETNWVKIGGASYDTFNPTTSAICDAQRTQDCAETSCNCHTTP